MKVIQVDLYLRVFNPRVLHVEKLKVMYRVISAEDGGYIPRRTDSANLLPYSDELWNEVMDMKMKYDALWQRRLALRHKTLRNIHSSSGSEGS